MRLAIADLVSLGEVKEKFSATVALGVVRFVANATLGRKGKLCTLDVAGAYLHGKPLTPEQGGRVLFAKVPPGFEQFGYPEKGPRREPELLPSHGQLARPAGRWSHLAGVQRRVPLAVRVYAVDRGPPLLRAASRGGDDHCLHLR